MSLERKHESALLSNHQRDGQCNCRQQLSTQNEFLKQQTALLLSLNCHSMFVALVRAVLECSSRNQAAASMGNALLCFVWQVISTKVDWLPMCLC